MVVSKCSHDSIANETWETKGIWNVVTELGLRLSSHGLRCLLVAKCEGVSISSYNQERPWYLIIVLSS